MYNCCLTACQRWKLLRRGYVPMDIYCGNQESRGCGYNSGCGCGCCGANQAQESSDCGCNMGFTDNCGC